MGTLYSFTFQKLFILANNVYAFNTFVNFQIPLVELIIFIFLIKFTIKSYQLFMSNNSSLMQASLFLYIAISVTINAEYSIQQ